MAWEQPGAQFDPLPPAERVAETMARATERIASVDEGEVRFRLVNAVMAAWPMASTSVALQFVRWWLSRPRDPDDLP